MSLHRSLKTKSGALEAHRNVLTRPERIAKLKEKGDFDPEKDEAIHLPKVRNIKIVTKKKKTTTDEEGETTEEGAATTEEAKS